MSRPDLASWKALLLTVAGFTWLGCLAVWLEREPW